MRAVSGSGFTAKGIASMLVNENIAKWGLPKRMLSDNGLQFSARLRVAVTALLGTYRLFISSYHAMGNVGTKRVNHNWLID